MKMFFYYLIVINIISFFFYGLDKLKAKYHKWRIPEMVLLNLSVIGGCFGSIIGMSVFHHKTKKLIFKIVNAIFFIGYIILICYVVMNCGGKV